MSKHTRINRPTTSTPRKIAPRRVLHVSTNLVSVKGVTIRAAKGATYRRPK